MNKKAESSFENAQTIIFFTVMMFAATILIFTFAFLLNSYQRGLTDLPGKFEAEMVSLRFANSPDCFAYQDAETKRIFPGIIDADKFNQQQLQVCYRTDGQSGKEALNFRLQLESSLKNSLKTNNYFNVDSFTIVKDVVVKTGAASGQDGFNAGSSKGKFSQDKLFIYVQDGLI
ncbi:MAG TPA: hypothetical protein VJH68_04555 [Candidatus Nanoarchaeia archaeon]|nr:hypothetical protein [Candidatus Nanoarchaeia archaeon]